MCIISVTVSTCYDLLLGETGGSSQVAGEGVTRSHRSHRTENTGAVMQGPAVSAGEREDIFHFHS